MIVIAGGGPTGMVLAAELALAGVETLLVEKRRGQELESARAGGLHARTIELFDQRGVAERFLAEGTRAQIVRFAGGPLDISDFPTRHNYGLALWQNHIERILAAWVAELRVPALRETEVVGFAQDETGIDVQLSGGRTVRAQYLVGCDGGRSFVRKHAGIAFPGWEASVSYLIAEATLDEPALGLRHGERGVNAIAAIDGGRSRMVLVEPSVRDGEPGEPELREALAAVYGTDFGIRDLTWLSRFSDAARQAARYHERRVLLAGDAAHVHSPTGGQGLNLGVQDAFNLGWKLARVVHGTSDDGLLDSYHAERQPIGARVLQLTMALTAMQRGDDRTNALRATVADLVQMAEPRKRYAAMLSGLDIRYDLDGAHPLVGRRMPDLDLVDGGRVYELLHAAQPVALDGARCVGPWELPVVGAIAAPPAVLIRPDGHVAWVGEPGATPPASDAFAGRPMRG
ncbi:MAG TPA: FAD-dependent monooxygenase [Kofleriaceae bacterium]|jgi:2-polyprenyl-6-methoxyphenol hydroxylase-like FAD-dependent oxidoreductase